MKKIINGRKYDTETATLLAEDGCYTGDFHSKEEELYRKRTGEYFLYGYGGSMTRWAQAVPGGGWGNGEGIAPLSESEARDWAESHCSADMYEQIFGEVEE